MSELFGDDIITITDEDGVEYVLEVLATLESEGSVYYALVPVTENDEEEDLEVSILKAVEENGEEVLITIDDDDEFDRVADAFDNEMMEEYDLDANEEK